MHAQATPTTEGIVGSALTSRAMPQNQSEQFEIFKLFWANMPTNLLDA